ncbi:hypothetical protein SESBI_37825 [Sesbania bispinosa]|nr:hypothetical protein SESBI_37825 [Sesbania bispinosa]
MSSSPSSPFQKLHNYSVSKACKSFVFPTFKPTNSLSLFLKVGLAFCTFLFFISLFYYLSLSYHPHAYHHIQFQHSLSPFTKEEPTNISHLVFGIGGTANTWQNRRHYTELWWRPNSTRGFLWFEQEIPTIETWPQTLPPYKVSGNMTSFKHTLQHNTQSASRLARILEETFEIGLQNVRWFVMGDDDTVFFPENLVTVLAKYDHNQMYYIGSNSESVEQNVMHSYAVAYGGGGFAISYALAAEVVKILDGCIERYANIYGSDQKIQRCISEIGVPVTKELGFHQVDVRGNLYGLLAAHPVAPLVSLHHLDYVEPMFPNTNRVDSVKKLISAYEMDSSRILQRSMCYDLRRNWTVSVSWGYNVELYCFLSTSNELETPLRTFRTWWSKSEGPFTFNTRTERTDPCERPVVFFLDRVESVGEGGRAWSTYVRYDAVLQKDVNKCVVPAIGVQYVNVSASKFMPELWKKAPRRQCCDIIDDPDEVSTSVVQVKIRGCQHFESLTPP